MGSAQLGPSIKWSLGAVAFCIELHLHFIMQPLSPVGLLQFSQPIVLFVAVILTVTIAKISLLKYPISYTECIYWMLLLPSGNVDLLKNSQNSYAEAAEQLCVSVDERFMK